MGENIFALPPMTIVKYHKFLQVTQKYDMKEVKACNLSFTPGGEFMDKFFFYVKSTDFLIDRENDVDMIVPYDSFSETIEKAESARFMESFKKTISWSLHSNNM